MRALPQPLPFVERPWPLGHSCKQQWPNHHLANVEWPEYYMSTSFIEEPIPGPKQGSRMMSWGTSLALDRHDTNSR
jgi:hypothetical protein